MRRKSWIAFAAAGVIVAAGGVFWRARHVRHRIPVVTESKLFTSRVAPILEETCIHCHGADKQKGGLRLDTLAGALKGGKSGPALVPGDTDKSLLLKLVHRSDPDRPMPPTDELRPHEVASLEKWVSEGAPWPASMDVIGIKSAAERIGDAWSDPRNPIAKLFKGKRLDLWSLKPVTRPESPVVKDSSWGRNPIDRFVLARLEAAGAKPAPEADRRTLARRVYFDLTGMPPDPAEVEAFVKDSSADAYEKLVDQLLDSPRYGEHWARLWLDVVRYSDSNGFDYDEFRPHAWRFRDYVIRSLNMDKPFDRFVREQIAGDEMLSGPPRNAEEQDCLVATGYLRIGPFDGSAAGNGEAERCHMQVMSDLVETTASAFLGLTFACCRCHDHKIDPVSQADYYRMRAFFEGLEPKNTQLLDLAAQQKVIRREQADVQQKRKLIAEIDTAVAARFRLKEIEKLPPDEKALIGLSDAEKRLPENRKKVHAIEKSIQPTDKEIRANYNDDEKRRIEEIGQEIAEMEKKRTPYTPALLATDTCALPPATHVLAKGDFRQPKEEVRPGVLSVFDPNPLPEANVKRESASGRRTALAEWLLSASNPLTRRVIVNRIWQGHFGEGLQATPNEFGLSGARPTHPELLDWLADEFVHQGWSLKKLHRLIATSATFRQSLPGAAASEGAPPPLSGQMPRRLNAEQLRDSMLAVAGRLLPCDGGPPLWPELPPDVIAANPGILKENEEKTRGWYPSPKDKLCVRSIYLVQKRSLRVPLMETFDLPENSLSCGRRIVSTVAPQALALLNDPFAEEMAVSFAERLQRESGADSAAQIDRAFAIAFQRAPDAGEREQCLAFLKDRSLQELCRALMNLNEFAYVD